MERQIKWSAFVVATTVAFSYALAMGPASGVVWLDDLEPYAIAVTVGAGALAAALQVYQPIDDYFRRRRGQIPSKEARDIRSQVSDLDDQIKDLRIISETEKSEISRLHQALQEAEAKLSRAPAETARKILQSLGQGDTTSLSSWLAEEGVVDEKELSEVEYLLGRAARERGKWEVAERHFKRASALNDRNEDFRIAWQSAVACLSGERSKFSEVLLVPEREEISAERAYSTLAAAEHLIRRFQATEEVASTIERGVLVVVRQFSPWSEIVIRALALSARLPESSVPRRGMVNEFGLVAARLAQKAEGVPLEGRVWAYLCEAEADMKKAMGFSEAEIAESRPQDLDELIQKQVSEMEEVTQFEKATLPLIEAERLLSRKVAAAASLRHEELLDELIAYLPSEDRDYLSKVKIVRSEFSPKKAVLASEVQKKFSSLIVNNELRKSLLMSLCSKLNSKKYDTDDLGFEAEVRGFLSLRLLMDSRDYDRFIEDTCLAIPRLFDDNQQVSSFLSELQGMKFATAEAD